MAKKPQAPKGAAPAPTWTRAELLGVQHLGPGIIGEEMFRASQALVTAPGAVTLGPAILDPHYHEKELAAKAAAAAAKAEEDGGEAEE